MDAASEKAGVAAVEDLFVHSASVSRTGVAFARFLGGDQDESVRALKKDYHAVLEKRLRGIALRLDPAENHCLDPLPLGCLGHPLDPSAWDLVSGIAGDIPADKIKDIGASIKASHWFYHWLTLLAWAGAFLGGALMMLVRQGRPCVTPHRAQVATPDFWGTDFWAMLQGVIKDKGLWRDDSLLTVRERGDGGMEDLPFPDVDPQTFRVPIAAWMRQVVLPSFRLVATVLLAAFQGRRDRRAVEVAVRALNLAATSLNVWRIAFNVRSRWYVDVMDYSAIHNVKAVIFRSFGTGLVCWPYHQLESPGVSLSYLGYDLFFSGGPYQHREYSSTWFPGLRAVSVGQVRNDRRLISAHLLVADFVDPINQCLANGKRMAVLFAGNDDPGFHAAGLTLFRETVTQLATKPGWFLVIKTKKPTGPDSVINLMERDPVVGPLLRRDDVIILPRLADYQDGCPAAWMIERMTLGISLPGSIQWEGLARGKPIISYFPVNQDTPALRFLKDQGLLHETGTGLRTSLEWAAKQPDAISVPTERVCADFDLFGDDAAMERIVETLFDSSKETLE